MSLAVMLAGAAAILHPGTRYVHLNHTIWAWIGAESLLSLLCLFMSAAVSSRGLWREFACVLEFPGPFNRKAGRHLPWMAGYSVIIGGLALLFGKVGYFVVSLFLATEGWRWMMKRKHGYVRSGARSKTGD